MVHVVAFISADETFTYFVDPAKVDMVQPITETQTMIVTGGYYFYVRDNRHEVFRKLGWTHP